MNAAYLLRVLTVALLMLFSTGLRASDVPVAASANGAGITLVQDGGQGSDGASGAPHGRRSRGLFHRVFRFMKVVLIIFAVLMVLAFKEELIQLALFIGVFCAIGALVFHLLFDKGELGALAGFILAVIVGLRGIAEAFGMSYAVTVILSVGYHLLSLPFYCLNHLQYFLSEPWRYVFRRDRLPDRVKKVLRPVLEALKVVMYVLITPLRLLNAVYFNIFVHGLTEFYDLFIEVLSPCSRKEGAGSFWRWLVFFPWRLLKYPVWHGFLTLVETLGWSIADIFIPTLTMYHGTDLPAAQNITATSGRNDYLASTMDWNSGTFRASESSWGGIGVYFASDRAVAKRYAGDPYRLSDNNPVVIVCRVSPGRMINYALAPSYVYAATGRYGHPPTINRYAEKHGYVSGEWWNDSGKYWEYCLLDWQNLYNFPWRIRPLYVFNCRTRLIQHVKGGMKHWFFKI